MRVNDRQMMKEKGVDSLTYFSIFFVLEGILTSIFVLGSWLVMMFPPYPNGLTYGISGLDLASGNWTVTTSDAHYSFSASSTISFMFWQFEASTFFFIWGFLIAGIIVAFLGLVHFLLKRSKSIVRFTEIANIIMGAGIAYLAYTSLYMITRFAQDYASDELLYSFSAGPFVFLEMLMGVLIAVTGLIPVLRSRNQ